MKITKVKWGFSDKLTDNQIKNVLAYVKSYWPEKNIDINSTKMKGNIMKKLIF